MIHKIRRINIAEWSISNEFLSPVSEEPVRNDDEDRGGHRDLDLPPRRYQKLHCRFDHHRHNHNHHHHQAQQPRKSTTTQKSKYQNKNRNKKIIYTSNKRSGPWLLRSLKFLGFRIFQNHEISKQRSTKNSLRERKIVKDSKAWTVGEVEKID